MAKSVFDTGGYIGYVEKYPFVPIVKNGLVLHLDAGDTASYPRTGTTWYDLSGNGNHATLYNSPTWSNTNGGTFTFNGTNQYAACGAGFANFTGGITIFGILNFGSASFWERIIDFGNGSASDNILFARNSTSTTLSLEIYTNLSTSGGYVSATNGVLDNTIACYAATANGTNSVLYRNGASIYSQAYTALPRNISRSNCYIGRSNWPDAYFETTMNVIMIYNRALTATEIAQNFNSLRSRYSV